MRDETATVKNTLEFALRPHAIPGSILLDKYRPVMMMVRQILGVLPRAMSYFEIWPPGLLTYSVLVPSFLDIPRCDLGRGIAPSMRSLVMYSASRSHGCAYCSAHSASIGTIFKGAGGSLPLNQTALAPEACDLKSAEELATIDYATAAAKFPSAITLEDRLALARNFSEAHEESVVLASSLMGFLNCSMDSLGMVLEWRMLKQGEQYLSPTGWEPRDKYEEVFDAELVAADREAGEVGPLGPLALARTMAGIIAFDRGALKAIPGRPVRIYALVRDKIGFLPYYVERIERASTKRVVAHCLVQRLQLENGSVTTWLRHTMCFIAAKQGENDLLAAHFAYGAVRAGATIKHLLAALEPNDGEGREAAAYNFTRAAICAPAVVSPREISGLMDNWTPAAIMELVTVVSIHGLLNRYTSTYPATSYEPEIEAFVVKQGEALGLPRTPNAGKESWDERAASARSSR